MNLIVDIGNTSTKIAVFKGQEKLFVTRVNELSCEELGEKMSQYTLKKVIVSSVKTVPHFISDLLFQNIPFVHVLSYKSLLPFSIEYETPETLGADRIAAAAGAYGIFPDSEIMIIDAGTAITFDFLSANVYRGGNISPGISMRFKALHNFTSKLPLVSLTENYTFPGRNTVDAIAAGVITGVTYEINEYIRTFEKKHDHLKIILTGGDSGFLNDKINYQHSYMPDIVIDGLNNILEYNAT